MLGLTDVKEHHSLSLPSRLRIKEGEEGEDDEEDEDGMSMREGRSSKHGGLKGREG